MSNSTTEVYMSDVRHGITMRFLVESEYCRTLGLSGVIRMQLNFLTNIGRRTLNRTVFITVAHSDSQTRAVDGSSRVNVIHHDSRKVAKLIARNV